MAAILPGAKAGMARLAAPILASLACVCASQAQAAPGQAEYRTRAEVDAICGVATQIAPMSLTTTVDKNGKIDPALVNTSFDVDGIICTGPSQIVVSATSLRLTRPRIMLAAGQSQAINFIATATGWTANPATVTTRDRNPIGSLEVYVGVPQIQYNAKSGRVTVHVGSFVVVSERTSNGNGSPAKPVDGDYAATITISLSPKG